MVRRLVYLLVIDLIVQVLFLNFHDYGILDYCMKSLGEMVKKVFPYASHWWCAKHICDNLKSLFPGRLLQIYFWEAERASTKIQFENAMKKLKDKDDHKRKIGGEMLRPIISCENMTHQSGVGMCLMTTQNLTIWQTIWLNPSTVGSNYRGKPILDLLDYIRQQLMVRLEKRYAHACACTTKVPPKIVNVLDKITLINRHLKVLPECQNMFEVFENGQKFAVSLDKKTCTCNLSAGNFASMLLYASKNIRGWMQKILWMITSLLQSMPRPMKVFFTHFLMLTSTPMTSFILPI